MDKEERIKKYGTEAYEKKLQQDREWHRTHREEEKERRQEWDEQRREEHNATSREWSERNPKKVKAKAREQSRKGGKYYEQKRKYFSIGIPHERELVRMRHGRRYRSYKQIIAPDSQIHHEWIPETANYTGVALVEKDQHQHGFIDVIQILEGKITVLTEAELWV